MAAGVGFEPTAGLNHPARDFESPAFVRSATPPELKIIGMNSMTGFGRGVEESEGWKVSVMMRSLNGKGLDVNVRMPSFMMPVEPKIKDRVREKLRRGSVQVVLDVESKQVLPPVDVDRLVKNAEMLRDLSRRILSLNVSDDTIFELSWKYSEKAVVEIDEELEKTALRAVDTALEELLTSRQREGRALQEDLAGRADRIEELLQRIVEVKDRITERIREKVTERAKRLNLTEEHPLVLNEITFLLEKMDVEEEVTRLRTHLSRFRKLLTEEGDVGKKLEFLAQEMHREINTLGNKIPELSQYVVEIKAEIDRIKQQAANVE